MFTTNIVVDAPLFRLRVEPSKDNSLLGISYLMVDKIITVQKGKLGRRIGKLDAADLTRLNRAMVVFLGLADRR